MNNQTFEIEPLIQDYLAAWNSTDSTIRALLLDKVLAPDCIYADSHLPNLVETKELHGQFIDRFLNGALAPVLQSSFEPIGSVSL